MWLTTNSVRQTNKSYLILSYLIIWCFYISSIFLCICFIITRFILRSWNWYSFIIFIVYIIVSYHMRCHLIIKQTSCACLMDTCCVALLKRIPTYVSTYSGIAEFGYYFFPMVCWSCCVFQLFYDQPLMSSNKISMQWRYIFISPLYWHQTYQRLCTK